MMRFIGCLIFILTNSVLAQAQFEPGTIHVATPKWVITHSGETEVYGLPILATLEEATPSLGIPDAMAVVDFGPSVMPVVKHQYRLTFLVSHNPRIQSSFLLQPRNITLDGQIRFAYVSEADQKQDFRFFVTSEENGALHVTFVRNQPSEGGEDRGEFTLQPVPHTLVK